MSATIKETVKETKESEDYVSIKDITSNKFFTNFTIVVDKEAYENSMDGVAVMTLGMSVNHGITGTVLMIHCPI